VEEGGEGEEEDGEGEFHAGLLRIDVSTLLRAVVDGGL
jgi:hypothetical protein